MHSLEPDCVVTRVKVDGSRIRVIANGDLKPVVDADVIVVALKTQDTEQVAQKMSKLINPTVATSRKKIISLQNGVAAARILRKYLGDHHDVLSGIVVMNVVRDIESPATYVQRTSGNLIVEDDGSALLHRFQEIIVNSGIPLYLEPTLNVAALQYGKICVNMLNAVNALCGRPVLETIFDRDIRRVWSASTREAFEVFTAAKLQLKNPRPFPLFIYVASLELPPNWFEFFAKRIFKIEKKAKTSMLQDLESRRSTTEV